MKVTLLGSGRVATHLSDALSNSGHQLRQVFSPTLENAQALANRQTAQAINQLSEIDDQSDIYLIAIVDDALKGLAEQLRLPGKLVAHTSGSIPMEVLAPVSDHYGVFYPLQSFSPHREVNFAKVPLCIEGADIATTNQLLELAGELSESVQELNSEQRKIVHLAAVFANNFTNHMYAIADDILTKEKLSLDLLRPLILETAERALENAPHAAQTGPAARGDEQVMARHEKMLESSKSFQKIYTLVSQSIRQQLTDE